MIDIAFIRNNQDLVKEVVKNKKGSVSISDLIDIDNSRREILAQVEDLRARKNAIAQRIKSVSEEERFRLIEEGKETKEQLSVLEAEYVVLEEQYLKLMLQVPNVYSDDTPIGSSEDDNIVLRQVGEKSAFDFDPKEHWEIGKRLGLIDTEKSAEVSGSRFAYIKGDLVLMQFALISWVMEVLSNKQMLVDIAQNAQLEWYGESFVPVIPPVMMRSEVMERMGRLHPMDERYQTTIDGLMLVGSAEHTLGPLHMDQVLTTSDLPLRYVGYSTAFRREAGTYGKDMKGILRLHQFDKIEIETFTTIDKGYQEQDLILAIQEYLMQQLKLPYQVVLKCTADMGDPDIRARDIETWLPGQNAYRETHTSDYMGDFQARRLNTRYTDNDGKKQFVHMNDATVFAIGRILIAIMENYQQKDGSILVPEVLQSRMNKTYIK